ncbi:TonB-dependent receptor [Flavobacterium cyanobacteriorum]|uniref:TonB-dependent receptor n=1 Tax=Flavobacterium cyanobacteriorum TaxID=2022802 RepID=A0A255Z1A7_9FLAO|nr:TonB-dependent receptor [Flavobacterium cyanobacteriorum]OYQ34440.1 TonB-dependent receptor [Flavobacterium cyanobacteriorum]
MQSVTKAIYYLIILFPALLCAQETDTTRTTLEEVVVTGQIEPQSLKKSVFNVRVITRQDIQQQAAVNLADLLNQYINITVMPNSTNGRSTISMFGLDGQYMKVLVDNVPLVSDTGLGNNTDLSQINLDDVEQIEIIEGAMGVTHGANAVSGILNIITKKSSKYKWEAFAAIQEETAGKEYAWFDKGRHIQSLKISNNINDNWFASIGANRTQFAGFYGDREGKEHTVNDGRRGYIWLPEEQLVTNAMLSYKKNGFRAFYKFEYLTEAISYYNFAVQSDFIPPSTILKFSNDERFLTERFYHHLNGTGRLWNRVNYNVSVSHQKQERDYEKFKYYIETDDEVNNSRVTNNAVEVLYSTGTFSNFFESKKVNLQLGYETVNTNGFALVDGENQIPVEVRRRLENYDIFLSGEVNITDRFSMRPGYRYSFQSAFNDQHAVSLGLRQLLNHGMEARASVGRSYRTPNFDELYSRLVFSGHYFIGNPSLSPEAGLSYEVSLKKNTSFSAGGMLSNSLIVSFLDIDDKIDMALVGFEPSGNTPIYQYINISKYRMWNISTTHQYAFNNFNARLGASLIGISQEINNGSAVSDDKFLYSLQLNTVLSYNLPKWNTLFSVYYKFNGRQQRFYESTNGNGDPVYKISTLDAYSWLDASIRKTFFKDRFDVTLGARNLLDIVNIQQTQNTAGSAHAASTDILLGYGRSYFLRLSYNFNF